MTKTATPELTEFRLIDDGERLAIHRVAIDNSGAVVAWDPEPARLEVPSGLGLNGKWRITADAFAAANATSYSAPVMLLRDGKLIEMPAHGGEDAASARTRPPAIAA